MDSRLDTAKAASARGDLIAARVLYAAVLRDDPTCWEAALNLGGVFSALGDDQGARHASAMAVRIRPDDHRAWGNLGITSWRLRDYPAARACMEEASRLGANDAGFFFNASLIELHEHHFEKAVELLDMSLSLEPGNLGRQKDRALAMLHTGDWGRAWPAYEARWHVLKKSPAWYTGAQEWQGEMLRGRSILVHHEQGNGDTLQACRFVAALAVCGARVTFAVPHHLLRLMRRLTPRGPRVLGTFTVVALADRLPQTDFHAPLMSLMRWQGYDSAMDISGRPYLRPSLPEIEAFPTGRFNVGICWAVNQSGAGAPDRSIDISTFEPLLTMPGVRCYSLTKGAREGDAYAAGLDAFITDLSPRIHDYDDTARLIAGLDCVVTVDTSVAHLAGAVGADTIMLVHDLPCWRWQIKDGRTSWYDSMTIVQQLVPRQWREPVAEAARRVQQKAQACAARAA